MKRILFVIPLVLILLLTSCNDIVRPATETRPHNSIPEETAAPESVWSPQTRAAQTESDTSLKTLEEALESEVTTAAEETRPSFLEEGERIVYSDGDSMLIEGSRLLFGEEEEEPFWEDTKSLWEGEPEEGDEEEEEEKYPVALMYHCIHDEPYTKNTALFVRPSEFEAHCRVIEELELDCLFADEFGPVESDSVILTFDDGYEDNYTYMFPIIKEYNVKVTIYMIAYKIDKPGYLTREQIIEMSESGLVQFGSHTLDHPCLNSLSEDGIRKQMEGSNWIISQITGKPVTTIAYPGGDYNRTVTGIAEELYQFAYTTDDDPYWGQSNVMLPRYAIMRGMGGAQFRIFVQ